MRFIEVSGKPDGNKILISVNKIDAVYDNIYKEVPCSINFDGKIFHIKESYSEIKKLLDVQN